MSYTGRMVYAFQENVQSRGLRLSPTTKDGDRAYSMEYAFPAVGNTSGDEVELDTADLRLLIDTLVDIIEEQCMEVTILPAQYPRKEAPVDYPQGVGHSELAKQIGKICKP